MTPIEIKKAWEMRERGWGWETIAEAFGISRNSLRARIDPRWAAMNRERSRQYADRIRHEERRRLSSADQQKLPHYTETHRIIVPPEVLAEKELAFEDAPTIAQAVLGDPPFLRSALGRKLQNV